jgi:hypothetical protein
VRNANGQALSYVYYESEPGRRSATKLLSKDEARRIAANIAELPTLLVKKMRRNHCRWGQVLAWPTQASRASCALGTASKMARQCGHRKKSTLPFRCLLVTSM